MKKASMFFAAALFAFATTHAFAFGTTDDDSTVTAVSAPAAKASVPGAAMQVGKFFGGLLKSTVAVGRDVATGFKAGLAENSSNASNAAPAAHMAPVEHRTFPRDAMLDSQSATVTASADTASNRPHSSNATGHAKSSRKSGSATASRSTRSKLAQADFTVGSVSEYRY